MNQYIEHFINMYECKGMWDTRSKSIEKAFQFPLDAWIDITNNPKENNVWAAYRFYGDHKVQGILSQDRKYFLYECTPRYANGSNYFTFILLSPANFAVDNLGYSDEYLYIRDIVENVKTFADSHTYMAYSILKEHENFQDITSYREFLTRYVGINGAPLCTRKHVHKILSKVLGERLNSMYDFNMLEWETYREVVKDELKPYFSPKFMENNNDMSIWIDCGLYEDKPKRIAV